MLYVFHVDTGTMLTLDMTLAMDTVSKLQEVIGRTCKISPDKQVLLISGGENLDPSARVCSYAAGTDTNPIYLFSKSTIEAAIPPSASVSYGAEMDLSEQVEGCKHMSATYETVVARTQLSLQLEEVAKEEMSACEKLVHDQHLQHQGWAAVVANLEDITSAFQSRTRVFLQHMDDYLLKRQHYVDMLAGLSEKLELLSRIPLLPCLLKTTSDTDSGMGSHKHMLSHPITESVVSYSTSPPPPPMSPVSLTHTPANLLDWISAQDSRNSLEKMVMQCRVGIEQLDSGIRDTLSTEVGAIIESIKNPSMKEVKGLEDRLYGLEQLMFGARKIVQEQSDMAAGFVQNQNRARNLKDMSVIPDLCASHRKQLEVMLKNQQSLVDIKRRCMAAKEELSVNLHTRLRWVMYVEKSICDVDSKLVVHHDTLKKLRKRLEITQQMYNAPDVYCSAVVEVVRRRSFSDHFLKWSHALANDSGQVQESETAKRDQVTSILKHHFLQALFPGFGDKPPGFAMKSPDHFDEDLPSIKLEDIDFLKERVPELADKLKVPDEQDVCRKLLVYTPVPSPAELNLPTPNLMQSVSSDIVVLCNTDDQRGDLNLKGPESISDQIAHSEQKPAQNFIVSVKGPDDMSASVEVIGAVDQQMLLDRVETKHRDEFLSVAESPNEPPVKIEKKSLPTPGTSPDAEDTEGFTTADFYIDESLPSSMTESARSRKLVELQQQLTEKCSLLEQRDKEIQEKLQESVMLNEKIEHKEKEMLVQSDKLQNVEEMVMKAKQGFSSLNELVEKGMLQMKCDVLSLGKQIHKDKDEFSVYVESLSEKLARNIAQFEQSQKAHTEETVNNLTCRYESEMQDLRDKLEVEQQRVIDADREASLYLSQVRERDNQIEKLNEEILNRIDSLQQSHATELVTLRNSLVLEHELELDKAKVDLKEEFSQLETKLTELKTSVEDKTQQIDGLHLEKEQITEKLNSKFQREKDDIIKLMQSEYAQKETKLRREMEEYHKTAVNELETKFASEKKAVEKEFTQQINLLKETHNADINQLRVHQEERRQAELTKRVADLSAKHESEIARLTGELDEERKRHVEALKAVEEAEPAIHLIEEDYIPLERHGEIVNNVKAEMELEKKREFDELCGFHEREMSELVERHDREIALVRSEHKQNISQLERSMEKEKVDSLQMMKSSMTAEKQVLFNEALDRAVAEKEKKIQELLTQQNELVKLREKDQALIEELRVAKEGGAKEMESAARDRETRTRMVQRRLEDDLAASKVQILELQSQLHSLQPAGGSIMAQSVTPLQEHSPHDRVQQLEQSLQKKDEEMVKLRHKVMELSMSTSSRSLVQDKVAITSCSIGDTVLLCLDERHDHYVVFTVGSVLHFLHSDCLEALGLKSGPGEAKKSWVLAEITDKEYCQAKKPQNRFKVPVGAKFYRVKARPWTGVAGIEQPGMMVRSQHHSQAQPSPGTAVRQETRGASLATVEEPSSLEDVKLDS